MKKRRVLIVTAMDKENHAVVEWIKKTDPHPEGVGYMVVSTGIGKVNAAMFTAHSICRSAVDGSGGVECVLSVGCCGSLTDEFKPGAVVVGLSHRYSDVYCGQGLERGQVQGFPVRFMPDMDMMGYVCESMSRGCKGFLLGHMLTGDTFVEDSATDSVLRELFPECDTVDMETTAIAHVCARYGIPFLAVRTVSDSPSKGANRGTAYMDFWSNGGMDKFWFMPAVLDGVRNFCASIRETGASHVR